MSDDDFIEAARQGQDHAAPFLVSLYGPKVLGYCRSIASDLSDVERERICEIAIEKAVRKIDRFDPSKGKFESWIRTFVLHAAQDWRRDHQRLACLDKGGEWGPPLTNTLADQSVTNAGEVQAQSPLLGALRDALPKLTELDQVIIHLRDIEQRSIEDVANLLGITQPACRQRHHRARGRLRSFIQADARAAVILTGEAT